MPTRAGDPGASLILHTSDGGATWIEQEPVTSESLGRIDFSDPLDG